MRACDEAGFTLLETLVAFAIAALALGILFEGASAALRTTATAVRLEGAVERARSHLAAAGVLIGSDGERVEEGADGALYRWRVAVSPGARATTSRPAGVGDPALTNALRLYRITVEERWSERGRERTFRLRSQLLFVGPPGSA